MKILIDARFYGLEHAGLGRYTINLIDELQKLDRKNKYIILLRKKYFEDLVFPKNWKKVLADFKHYGLREQIELPKLISKVKPDITHFLHFNIPVIYDGKYIVTIHDLLMQKHKNSRATTLPPYVFYLKHTASKIALKRALAKAEKIVVPSKAVHDEVLSFYKINEDKISVTYEGVNKNIAINNKNTDIMSKYDINNPYFMYVGNLYPHKNVEKAVEALSELNKKNDQKIMLLIISSRSVFLKRFQKSVKKLNADKYVKFLGFVPDNDLGQLYANSLAFIYPSLSEGFGLPGLEAMKSKTVVLASDIKVFREVYKKNAVYFDPFSTHSLVKKMEDVINLSTKKREIMIRASSKFASRYSWKRMAVKTLNIYTQLVK